MVTLFDAFFPPSNERGFTSESLTKLGLNMNRF